MMVILQSVQGVQIQNLGLDILGKTCMLVSSFLLEILSDTTVCSNIV